MRRRFILVCGLVALVLGSFARRQARETRASRNVGPATSVEPPMSAPPAEPTPRASYEPPPAAKPPPEEAFLHELVRLDHVDKEQALAYARQGDAWFGNTGALAEARKARIVTLLVDLGRMEEARAETRAFIAAYPDSSYRTLVQGVTGIHPRPNGPGDPR